MLGLRLGLERGVKLSGVRLDWTGPRVRVEVELGLGWVGFRTRARFGVEIELVGFRAGARVGVEIELGWVAFRAGVRLVIASRVGLNCGWSRS